MDLENSRSSSSSSISRIYDGRSKVRGTAKPGKVRRERSGTTDLLESVGIDVAMEIREAGWASGAIFGLQAI